MSDREINKPKTNILQLRDDFWVNIANIDNIELVTEHPGNNSKLDPPKYLIRYKNSYFNWTLLPIEDFEKYIKPFI